MPYKIMRESFDPFHGENWTLIAYQRDGVENLTFIELLNQIPDINPLQKENSKRMIELRNCKLSSEICDLLNKKATRVLLNNCEFGEEVTRLTIKVSLALADYSVVYIDEKKIDITLDLPESFNLEQYQQALQFINLFYDAAKKIEVQLGRHPHTHQLSEKQKKFLKQLPQINHLTLINYVLTSDIDEILRSNLSLCLSRCEANAETIQGLANSSDVADLTLSCVNLQNWIPVMKNPALRSLKLIYLQARASEVLDVLSDEIISALASHSTLFVLQLEEFTCSQSGLVRLLQNTNLRRFIFSPYQSKTILDPKIYQKLLLQNKNLLEHKAPDCYVSDAGQIEAHLQANRTRYDVIKITSAITAGLRTTHAHPFRDSLLRPDVVSTIFGFAEEEFLDEKLQNELKQKSFAQKFPFFAKLGHFVISRYCTAQVASPPDTPVARLQQN